MVKIKQRLYHKNFNKHNWLIALFQILILLAILMGGTYYIKHHMPKHIFQHSANLKTTSKFKSINVDVVIPMHPNTEPYESSMSMRKTLDIMIAEEKTLSKYMKGKYAKVDKEKLFYRFITNLEYYTQVFTEQNARRYYQNKHDSFYAGSMKLKMHLNKTVDEIEVERIEDELKPPNIKSPNVRIYSPKIPFVKLVFESYFDNGKARYYVLVPDYKYISGKYSKYLNKNWLDYFNIKVKQQEILCNSIYRNGNGGRFPYYISNGDVDSWTNDLVNIIQANPNFIMYDDIVKQIVYDNYPEYDFLLKKVTKDTKLYTSLQQAKLSVEAE